MTDKPLLRGVSHIIATFFAAAGSIHLLAIAPARAITSVLVYSGGLIALFGVSSIYHKPVWPEKIRKRLRRLDHSTIFIFIAATYTPICVIGLWDKNGPLILITVWICALCGVLKSLFWPHAPRFLTAGLYIAMGWIIIGNFGNLPKILSPLYLALLVGGGLLYTIGAVFYSLKRPNPLPGIFGYHEVFHAMVIGAALCHYLVIRSIVLHAA